MSFNPLFQRLTPRIAVLPMVSVAALALALNGCMPQSESMAEEASPEPPAPAAATVQSATTGEVPADLMESILEDLMKQEGLQRDAIEVERAESVIWSDGALGCPKPGEMYTHAQVPGYWVVLKAGDKPYDYRASEKGFFQRCNASFKLQLPVG